MSTTIATIPTGTTIRRTNLKSIIDLRHGVLTEMFPSESRHFEGDDVALHFAIFLKSEVKKESSDPISCVSLWRHDYFGRKAWQLRGMATANKYRGQGFGTALLGWVEESIVLSREHSRLIWCNVRVTAVNFYKKNGWNISDQSEFDIYPVGSHKEMFKWLE